MGGGLLAQEYPEARKAIWDLNGIFATSRHIAGVRFAGLGHPGVIGCAPSAEVLARWNRRKRPVLQTQSEPFAQAVVSPRADGALLGHLPASELERVAREAARTWAARENGGSIDVKELTRGSRVFLPVYLPGANLSIGDLQFSQGDGKITGFGGVKMAGWIDLHVDLIPDGMARYGISNPVLEPSATDRGYTDCIMFQGISVDERGAQHYLDIWTAYRQASRNAIAHLERFGYTGEQGYVLLAAAPIQGRISCMLEHPNVCCTIALPKGIFECELGPASTDIQSEPRGGLVLRDGVLRDQRPGEERRQEEGDGAHAGSSGR